MAERYATSSGNWEAARFDGGTLPGPNDVVRANGFSVEIFQDINVLRISTVASGASSDGGQFTCKRQVLINSDVEAGTTICLDAWWGCVIVGNSFGGTADGAFGSIVRFGAVQKGDSFGGSANGSHGSAVQSGGVQFGKASGGSVSGSEGSRITSGGMLILSSSQSSQAKAVTLWDDSTLILQGSASLADVDINATRYTIGNENHPFINPLLVARRLPLISTSSGGLIQ